MRTERSAFVTRSVMESLGIFGLAMSEINANSTNTSPSNNSV